MSIIIRLIPLAFVIHLSQTCSLPTMNNFIGQSDFNVHRFLGTWYEIKWYKNESQTNETIWNDFIQTFEFNSNSNDRLRVGGHARLANKKDCFQLNPWLLILANNSAKMSVEKTNMTSNDTLNWPYYILKTDYTHYALIYGCMSENSPVDNPCLNPMLWIFSRTVLLSRDILIDLDKYVENNLCMNLNELRITLHSAESCRNSTSLARRNVLFQANFLFCLLTYFIYISF